MAHDPNLSIQIEHDIAELGGSFTCTVNRSPTDGETNTKMIGQIQAVRIALILETEGRGTTNSERYSETTLPVDEYGMASGQVSVNVPSQAPISYDGALIRVGYRIEARTVIKLGRDQVSSAEVLVAPAGGLGVYDRPHPIR